MVLPERSEENNICIGARAAYDHWVQEADCVVHQT